MKKILSVVLSLLLVFSTISVVFTLPASAKTVTYTVFEENFDGLEQGSSLGSTQTIPENDGWVKTGAAYHDTVLNPTTDVDGFSFDAVSGTQVGAFKTWAKPGVVLNVTPGVTYNLTLKAYANDIGSNVIKAIYVFDVTGKEGSKFTENWARKTTVIDGETVNCFASADISSTCGAWLDGNISFTPAEGVTKVFIAFYSEANGNTYTETQKSLFIDDVKVTYSVEVGMPVVTTTTTGADNKNGGVAWVEEDGENFVFKAVPYETSTFLGWFRNDELVSTETTIIESASTVSNIEARFNAIYKNVFPEGSFENEIAISAGAAPGSSNALFWGNGRPTNDIKEIGANDWVGTSWAGIVVTDNSFIDSKLAGVKAYAGTKAAYISRNNNHSNFKVVRGLKTNTDYYLTYYVYQDKASALNVSDGANNGVVSYCTTGIPTGATSVAIADMNLKVAGDTNQTRIPYEYISDARTSSNAWTKHSMKFNTGNHTDVLINFCADGGNVFVDHASLYYKPSPEITVTTVGQGTNGGIAWTNNPEALPGDELTYSAKAYANAKFIGWYKNGEFLTANESFTQAYNTDETIEAKFDAFATNLDNKASAEEYAIGQIMEGSAHRSPWGEVTTNAYIKLNSDYPEIAKMYYGTLNSTNVKAYSGNKSLENLSNSHGFFKIYDVEPNSTYHFSYWYYQDSVRLESEGSYADFPDAAVIPANSDKIYIVGGSNVSNQLITKEGQKVIDLFRDTANVNFKGNNVVGEWSEVRQTILTGENDTKVVIPMPNSSGVYFDHFTMYKEPEFDSSYTFAVVPDTQKFNDDDIIPQDNDYDINAAFSKLYDDILAKKDSKNIQMVLSLGDITENSFATEYNRAKEQFARLDAANLPYTLVQGNHDYANQFKSNIDYATYKSTAEGSYNGILNTYHKFTVNGIKYLVFTLQYGAPDDVLAWASKVTEAHPDYNVIVTTHGYLEEEGLRLGDTDGLSPGSMGSNTTDENGKYTHHATQNHATEIWDKFVSQHENIVMVLCGHIDYDAIRITESYGVNGNKVLEMLIDGQNYDEYPRNENLRIDNSLPDLAYGMVAYFNFSADGKKLNIEYYSTNLEKLIYEITVDLDVVETEVETLTVESTNGGVVTINGDCNLNKEYRAPLGTSVTLVAEAYAGQNFLGWYEGETLLSTDATYTTTVATKTITAKFENNNIVADSSFENAPIGLVDNWTFGASAGTWAKALVIDSVSHPRTPDASLAYSGNKMLEIHHRNNAGMYFEVDVDKYAEYKLSLKWLLTLAYGDLTYEEALVTSTLKYVAVGTADQTYYQEGKMLAAAFPGNSDGLWTDLTLDFATGTNEKVRIFVEYAVGNADQYDAALGTSHLYIDDFAIVKTAQSEVCEHEYDNDCDTDCNKCGETRDASHKMSEWTVTTPATCSSEGEKVSTCENGCGHSVTEVIAIDANAHDMGDWEVTTPATCTTEGVETRTCKRGCGHTETQAVAIDANAHDWGEYVETTPGTCSTPAVETSTCKNDPTHTQTRDGALNEDAHSYDDEYDADCNDCGSIREVEAEPIVIESSLSGIADKLLVDETTTITVKLNGSVTATSAFINITLDEGLELVSGQWMVDGLMKDFIVENGDGVLALSNPTALTGDVFSFVIKGVTAANAQNISVTMEFKNESTDVGIATSTATINVEEEAPSYKLGDLNGDGNINNSDMILMRRFLAGWNVTINQEAANLDGRGSVNNSDAIWLARHLAGWSGYELD